MARKQTKTTSTEEKTATRILFDPARLALMAALAEESLSAAELSRQTDIPVEKVRYHLRVLVKAGFVESIEEKPRRGVMERRYVAPRGFIVDEEEFATLSPDERRRINSAVLRRALKDASRALVTGPLSTRADQCCVRVALEVDEQGWAELARIHLEALERVEAAKAKAAERLGRSSGKPIKATSVLLCFEKVEDEVEDPPG